MSTYQHDDRPPSQANDVEWVNRRAPDYQPWGDDGGKWTVYAPDWASVDEAWIRVRSGIDAGQLGPEAKVTTPLQREQPHGLPIIVYTEDADDIREVERVLKGLRALGFGGRLSYKEDLLTLAIAYGKGVSSFVAQPGALQVDDRRRTARSKADLMRRVTDRGWVADSVQPQPFAAEILNVHLTRRDPCSRCARDADEKCLDRWLQSEDRVRLSQVACGCGCWTRSIFNGDE